MTPETSLKVARSGRDVTKINVFQHLKASETRFKASRPFKLAQHFSRGTLGQELYLV